MSYLGQALFYVSSLVALAGALSTVLSRSAIRAAMGLLAAIVGIAGLFLTLSAQLLAAVQLILYAGAVVVLFVFVIMLMGPAGSLSIADSRTRLTRTVAAGLFALTALVALVVMLRGGSLLADANTAYSARSHQAASHIAAPVATFPHRFEPPRQELGTVAGLGNALLTDGVVALELSGVLLLVAIVGVMAVARSSRKPDARASAAAELQATKELAP